MQGSKKKCCRGCPGQVYFPQGQVAVHSQLLNGQGIRQVVSQLNHYKKKTMTCPEKENLRATCPKGKLESNFFRALNILIIMGGSRIFLRTGTPLRNGITD